MRLAFHGATTMTSDLETDVRVSAGAGFKGLEVWASKLDRYLEKHSQQELKALFTSREVKPLAINSIEFIAFRGAEYASIQARLHELAGIAQAIECPTVVVVPSPLPGRDMPWSNVVDEYVSVLCDLSGIAAAYGIRLSFEFLGFGWCSVRTLRGAAEIVEKCDRANVGLTIDAAHFYAGGSRMDEIDRIDAQRIFAFHLDDLEDTPLEAISDATRLLPGMGIVPLEEICARLKRIGYDGTCAVELRSEEHTSE